MANWANSFWALWAQIQANETIFWLVVGGLLLLVLALLLLVLRSSARRRRRNKRDHQGPTMFVPVDSEKETSEIFLPLSAKLVAESALHEHVSLDLLLKIRAAKPACLEDILQVWPQLSEPYREDLRRFIRSEQMLLLYARTLGENEYQPYTLAAAWRECPDANLLPEFVELLSSHQEAVQMAAVRLLIHLNEPQTLPYLASALLQPQRYVPARVAEVLVGMGESAAWLLAYLLAEIPSESKSLVLDVLSQMPVNYPLTQVLECLHDPDEQTRRSAAAVLGEHGGPEALSALVAAARDEKWSVRAAVAKALGHLGDPAALPTLEQLSLDQAWMVTVNAKEAQRGLVARQKQTANG